MICPLCAGVMGVQSDDAIPGVIFGDNGIFGPQGLAPGTAKTLRPACPAIVQPNVSVARAWPRAAQIWPSGTPSSAIAINPGAAQHEEVQR
jgi:hypothetical protein